ncbi:hypothetical protein GCM10008967_02800 [Bacillus carboniphilus]|uniref:Uncharacterized protein n=1 Tax=Bacillus carboniphilus TaxID=86663 RepID=A0ABN0VRQ9_9BACI
MKKYIFSIPGIPRSHVLKVNVFALPEYTPRFLHVHERSLHPYVHTSTAMLKSDSRSRKNKDKHYQEFYLSKRTSFLAKIIEGSKRKLVYVHIDPIAMKVIVEECFGHYECTKVDVYDIISCFTFLIGSQFTKLTIPREYGNVRNRRRPFILVDCLTYTDFQHI